MGEHKMCLEQISGFAAFLNREERALGTIDKYLRGGRAFAAWLEGRTVTKETPAQWKEHLLAQQYAPVTINVMLAAVNAFFRFVGWDECRVKFLRVQRRLFRDAGRELTKQEYERLVAAAERTGKERLTLLMESICGTGIRVSEVKYLTVEAAQMGKAVVSL